MSIIEKINDSTRNVHDLYFDLKNGKIFVDNSFQRRYVWDEKHQAALIETILLGYDIPPIYLWEQVPDDNGLIKLSVVDGQQRIGAIQAYIDGVFSLKKKYLSVEEGFDWIGKSFDELSKTDKDIIWKYKFKTREIDSDVSIDEIKTIFLRLNITNKVLNPQELRNARYNGEFIKLALELADIPFWKKHNIFSNNDVRRMLDVELVSNLLAFLRLGFKVSLGQKTLNELYDLFNVEYSEKTEDREIFTSIMSSIDELFDLMDNKEVHKTTHIYTLFVLYYKLQYDKFNGRSPEIYHTAVKAFYDIYTHNEEVNPYVEDYRVAASEGVKSPKNREIRYTSLLKYVEEYVDQSSN